MFVKIEGVNKLGVVVKQKLAQRARRIALKRGIPIVTVETVIKDYLEDLKESAIKDERIVIDGLTSISIIKDINGEYVPRGRVSTALKSYLNKRDTETEDTDN